MKLRSIRFRLTFWYVISLILAISVIFASFYFVTEQTLYTQTDSSLTSHSSKIVEVVTSQGTNAHEAMAKEAFVEEFSNIPGMFVVVMNSTGMIISSSQTVYPTDAVIRDLFETARQSKQSFFSDRSLGSQKLRFLVRPIIQNNLLLGVVIIGHSIDITQSALHSLIVTLGFVFVIFLFPVVLGGYLNARAAVQPISAISKKLKQINSGNLNERLSNPKTDDEIEELSVTFNSLLDRIHNAFQRERQFIGDMAHELKTPLATQRTGIEVMLSRDRTKEEYHEALKEALIDNNSLSSTLKNVLDLAWANVDTAKLQFGEVNLSEIVAEIMELATKSAAKKQIALTGTIEPKIVVSGKRDKLFHAIFNIVDNAIIYTPDRGSITLSLHKKDGQAIIMVKDTGIGIAQNDLPHIFERFYRGSSTDKEFGSGLGLAIADATIVAHQGRIEVKTKIGKGSEFTLFLPHISS